MSKKEVYAKGMFGEKWVVYADGTKMCQCSLCGRDIELDEKTIKGVEWKAQKEGKKWFEVALCPECYKNPEKHERTNAIEWGQSYNLAFQACVELFDADLKDKDFFRVLEEYHAVILVHIKEFKSREN